MKIRSFWFDHLQILISQLEPIIFQIWNDLGTSGGTNLHANCSFFTLVAGLSVQAAGPTARSGWFRI
jgi:hypothetical protein